MHSSDHPTIDYAAAEGTEPGEQYLKHYLAVFDPETNNIKITDATSLTVRGSVRIQETLEQEDDAETAQFLASQATRSALTEAFGSKKSKKAVQATAENRSLGQGIEGATIAEVITANVVNDEDEPVEATIIARSAKPLPQANITTDDIEEVYSIAKLVIPSPAAKTLQLMPLEPWKAKLKKGSEIEGLRSRFVANRVGYIGKRVVQEPSAKFTQQLQLLRYIALLIEIAAFCGSKSRKRRMDFVDEWPEETLTPGVSPTIVKQVVNHFFPDNTPSERAMTLLRTTILALTLHIVPPSGKPGDGRLIVDPTDIQLDLALEAADARKLYHELGCKLAPATDKDLIAWGLQRIVEKAKRKNKEGDTKMPKPMFAVLKFPLNFPKASMGRRR